jgi:hypothetical protein
MFRKTIFFLLAGLLAACTARPGSMTPSGIPVDTTNAEEQAVYAALLKQTYSASTFVIMDTTTTELTGSGDTAKTLAYVLQNMHDVAQGTVDSFRNRNDKGYPLNADMNLGLQYVLLSQSQRSQIFGQNQSGWEVFYSNYPNTPGITTLSRVGFNVTFDQALVYIGTQSNYLAGAGYYILLKKVNGAWTIDQRVMTWVS